MKNTIIIIALMLIPVSSWGAVTNTIIESTLLEGSQAKFVMPIEKNQNVLNRESWSSPNGIICSASLIRQAEELVDGSFEYVSQEGYGAQITIDCSNNISRETASFLFFGIVGDKENVGNFYVWCE